MAKISIQDLKKAVDAFDSLSYPNDPRQGSITTQVGKFRWVTWLCMDGKRYAQLERAYSDRWIYVLTFKD